MNILGISFGSRNGANDSMCKEALMGAEALGAEVKFVHILDWDIKNCTGCVACSRGLVTGKGNLCSLRDDLEELIEMMLDADGIVMATPIFEKGASGFFHTLNDRLGPRADKGMNIIGMKIAEEHGGKPVDPRWIKDKVISFMSIGGSDWGTGAQVDCAMLAMPWGWKVIENKVFQWSKKILMDDSKISEANELGKNLASAAANFEKAQWLGPEGLCPHCHSNNFNIEPGTKKAICCLCGIEGSLVDKGDRLAFEFPEAQLQLAHDMLPGKFKHGDDIKEIEGSFMEFMKTEKYKNLMVKYKSYLEPLKPASVRDR
jgi:multimeric flavodoxin WrbA